jgi:hypothetical protein
MGDVAFRILRPRRCYKSLFLLWSRFNDGGLRTCLKHPDLKLRSRRKPPS